MLMQRFEKTVDNKVVAQVILYVLEDVVENRRPAGYIHQVQTHKDHRRNGYATELVKQALKKAKAMNCYKCFLICDQKLVPLYKGAGMELQQGEVCMVTRFA